MNKRNNTTFRRKPNKRSETSGTETNKSVPRNERINDPNTWNSSGLGNIAGRVSFAYPMGVQNNLASRTHREHQTISGTDARQWRFPGIFTMKFAPTFGISKSSDDPVNQAAQKYFAKVRENQNAGAPYDPVDLMMFYLDLDSIFTWHGELTRVYGVLKNFKNTPWNYYTPKALVQALGFDYDDLVEHMDNLLFYINYLADEMSIYFIPKDIEFFARHIMLASNLFWDEPTVKSQIYAYVPGFYGKFIDETDGPGYIKAIPRPNYKMTYADIVNHTKNLFANITITQSFGRMNGDTYRAYGASGCYQASQIGDSFRYEPIYSREILGQIMNNTLFEDVSYASGKMLYQDTTDGLLHSNMEILVDIPLYDSPRIMRSFSDVPDATEIMINSRGMITGEIDLTTASQQGDTDWYVYQFIPDSLGTEIIFGSEVYTIDPSLPDGFDAYPISMYGSHRNAGYTGPFNVTRALSRIQFFSAHPIIYSSNRGVEFDAENHLHAWSIHPYFDANSYAIIDSEQLNMMHTAALMSVFNIPK